eukprot:124039-Chlamydomonas_euryale.AAC.1
MLQCALLQHAPRQHASGRRDGGGRLLRPADSREHACASGRRAARVSGIARTFRTGLARCHVAMD